MRPKSITGRSDRESGTSSSVLERFDPSVRRTLEVQPDQTAERVRVGGQIQEAIDVLRLALDQLAEASGNITFEVSRSGETATANTAPTTEAGRTTQTDSLLVRAEAALATLPDNQKPDAMAQRVLEIVTEQGPTALGRVITFLLEPARVSFGPETVVALSESSLDAKYDSILQAVLVGYVGSEDTHARYAAVTALGRRRGSGTVSTLRNVLPGLKDDPVLYAIAEDYLRARGADGSKTAQAS